ncbi:vegetative cell wall protein gp1-like [Geospiza fortis]|uniref:Vegetative cell wall protein gp1-like n=1 Tax=Geospiza fortis TaxID=48883 RepID=A0A8N5I4I8_GEOFO|nr:vegetative cell wall protein gp1-like [Geospiza fortis]
MERKLSLEQRTERLVQRRWESSLASSAPRDPQVPPGGPSLFPRSLSVVPDSKCSPDPQMPPQTSKPLAIPSRAPGIPRNASGTPSYPTRSQVMPQTPHRAHKCVPQPLKLHPRPPVPWGQCRVSISGVLAPPNLLLPSPARPCSGPAPAGRKG